MKKILIYILIINRAKIFELFSKYVLQLVNEFANKTFAGREINNQYIISKIDKAISFHDL